MRIDGRVLNEACVEASEASENAQINTLPVKFFDFRNI